MSVIQSEAVLKLQRDGAWAMERDGRRRIHPEQPAGLLRTHTPKTLQLQSGTMNTCKQEEKKQ